MLFSLLASLSLLASATLAQNTNQSAPFELMIISSNTTLNGSLLTACHEGAAIEGLCVSTSFSPPLTASTFNFNTSANFVVTNATQGHPGYVVWELRGGNFNVSEPLGFTYNTASNIAHPQFFPDDDIATYMAFDAAGLLNVQSYVNDAVYPAVIEEQAYYRWVVCITNTEGYTYHTLDWVLGDGEPQNPTCQKVSVYRKFI